jgi:hypothetical protein
MPTPPTRWRPSSAYHYARASPRPGHDRQPSSGFPDTLRLGDRRLPRILAHLAVCDAGNVAPARWFPATPDSGLSSAALLFLSAGNVISRWPCHRRTVPARRALPPSFPGACRVGGQVAPRFIAWRARRNSADRHSFPFTAGAGHSHRPPVALDPAAACCERPCFFTLRRRQRSDRSRGCLQPLVVRSLPEIAGALC